MKTFFIAALFMISVLCSSCASETAKRATYSALHDKQCIEDTGHPNCDPERMSYDRYKEERDKLDK